MRKAEDRRPANMLRVPFGATVDGPSIEFMSFRDGEQYPNLHVLEVVSYDFDDGSFIVTVEIDPDFDSDKVIPQIQQQLLVKVQDDGSLQVLPMKYGKETHIPDGFSPHSIIIPAQCTEAEALQMLIEFVAMVGASTLENSVENTKNDVEFHRDVLMKRARVFAPLGAAAYIGALTQQERVEKHEWLLQYPVVSLAALASLSCAYLVHYRFAQPGRVSEQNILQATLDATCQLQDDLAAESVVLWEHHDDDDSDGENE